MRDWRTSIYLAVLALGPSGCETPAVAVGQGRGEPEQADDGTPEPATEDDAGEQDDGGPVTAMGFVPDDDTPDVSTCDQYVQDCEPGFKCVPYGSTGGSWDANKCVPVLGRGQTGEPCTYDGAVEATDSCDASSMCWGLHEVDGQTVGTCTAFCDGTPDDPECPVGSACMTSCAGVFNVCVPTCNPLEQDCLGSGCYWTYSDFSCVFTTQDLEVGEPCGFINDCKPGLVCLDAQVMPDCEGAACCSQWCDLDDPTCAQAQTACAAFFEDGMAPPELENLGVCILPDA